MKKHGKIAFDKFAFHFFKNTKEFSSGRFFILTTCILLLCGTIPANGHTFWLENFSLSNGTTSDNGTTSWTTQNSTGTFAVYNNEFEVTNKGTNSNNQQGVWTSGTINIAGRTNVDISLKVRSVVTGSGVMNTSGTYMDYFRVYYKINNGPEVLMSELLGAINNHSSTYTQLTSGTFSGTSLQIIIRSVATGSDEFYFFDDVTVNGNFTATASASGALDCSTNSVTLNGSASISGVTYSWSGPNGFTSSSQNPSVSVAGTYNLTVTDANGITATASVTVQQNSGGSSSFWIEDFTFANGTTSDNGSTSWSISNPGSGTFSVQNNEFMASFSSANEGVWQSGVVDISAKTNMVVSVNLRSATAGTGDSFESDDHINVYYKLNGGSETLIFGNAGGLNGVQNNTSTYTVTSSAINGSTIQIVIRARNSDPTERYYFDNVTLTGSTTNNLSATSSVNGTLTCANTSVTLSGSSNTSGVTYGWAGPNNFSSSSQNPSVSVPGTYTLTVTKSSGCTATATVTVQQNIQNPQSVTASASGTLGCTNPNVTLNGSSTTSGVTYSWSGPGGFSSSSQSPSVNTAGTYALTVTNPANGCSTVTTVLVSSNTAGTTSTLWLEDFALANGTTSDGGSTSWSTSLVSSSGSFSVQNNEFRVTDIGTASGSQGVWTSGSINISGKTNVTISAEIRSSVNGSGIIMNSDPNSSYFDYLRIYYKINGGSEVLFHESISAINNHSTTNANVSIGGLSGSTLQIVIRARATASDEFYYFDNIKVDGVSPMTASASANGTLTCANTSVTLSGSSNTSGVTYSWAGPGGFSSTSQNPTVSNVGIYTLTVTNPSGECTATATTAVQQNIQNPQSVTASASGTLNCTNTNVTLNGSSTTSGVTYSWSGPGGFSSTSQNPTVSNVGTYTLTVTNPANGCSTATTVSVSSNTGEITSAIWLENFSLSNGTTSDGGSTSWSTSLVSSSGSLSVQNNEFEVTNIGTTSGSQGVWTSGSINISGKSNVSISLDIRSAISSGGVMNSDPNSSIFDYFRIYYKLNGGSEVLFYENIAAINNHSTTNTHVSFGSLSGTSLQVVIRARATGSDEFYYFDNVEVDGTSLMTASASASGTLTCTNTSVTLSGSSNTSGVTYSWSGPNSFSSSSQNPSVNTSGTYTLTVASSSGGCTATTTTTVQQNIQNPQGVTASASGTLSCTNTSVTLNGSSTTSGVTYGWSGPGGFTSSSQNPSVSNPGTYTLTVTNPSGGCTASATTTVNQNATVPANVVASNSGSLTCTTATVTISGSSTTPGITFNWAGPGGFSSTSQAPSVSTVGTYTLTITNPANGCKTIATTTVGQNINAPANVVANNSGSLTCTITTITLNASSSTSGVTYSWSGPGGFSSTSQNTNVANPGTYTLTVTNSTNGCKATATTAVNQNATVPANVVASSSGSITCTSTVVTLNGSSATSGVTYSWAGPAGFTSSSQNPSVSNPGTYTLTVTNPANGCKATTTVIVGTDTSKPGANITTSNQVITCTTINATLYGSSPTAGVSYNWSGPNGFTSTVTSPIVVDSGNYVLTITAVSNGCMSKDTITILHNKIPPGAFAVPLGQITCNNSVVTLQGSSTAPIVSYHWIASGGFNSTLQNPTTSVAGTYMLIVTDAINGCTSSTITTVTQNITPPANVSISNSGSLTCTTSSVTLNGSSSTSGVTYSWSGPGGFSTTGSSAITTLSGTYTLTVTNPANGCKTTATTTINQNTTIPANVTASNSGSLTCTTSSVTLNGSSSTSGVTYSWAGPGGFSASGSSVSAILPGTYTLTVTNPGNGCTTIATTAITQNVNPPANVSATNTGPITCDSTTITLMGSSTTSGVTFSWTGPEDFSSSDSVTTSDMPGSYILTVTDTVTGCTFTDGTVIGQNTTPPENVIASKTGSLTCTTISVTLNGSSTTAGVTYSWEGPEGFSASGSSVSTTLPGPYILTVTNPVNGCKTTANITVTQNKTVPANVTASNGGLLTCTTNSINLNGNSTTSGVIYSWQGPAGFSASGSSVSTVLSGTYTLTVTNPVNGCKAIATTIVNQNTTVPANVIASSSGSLTCTVGSVTLNGSSTTIGVNYNWTGPAGFSASGSSVSAVLPGTYTLTVTSLGNGCTDTATTTVTQNINPPANVSATNTGPITCDSTTITLMGNSITPGVIYSWSSPGGFSATGPIATSNVSGPYILTVTDNVTGCTITASTIVGQNTNLPENVVASSSGSLTCTVGSVTLDGSSTTADLDYNWNGPSGFSENAVSVTTMLPGTYTLTVTDPTNGCIATTTVFVSQNISPPSNVSATNNGPITCDSTTITLIGNSTTPRVTYNWSSPGGFSATGPIATTSISGPYILTITDNATGCTITTSTIVGQNTTIPICNIVAPSMFPLALQNDTITTDILDLSYSWSIAGAGWSVVSGENDPMLIYQAGSAGTSATITLVITDPVNGCSSTCSIELSAVTTMTAFTRTMSSNETTITNNAEKYTENDMQIDVYPNPFSDEAWIEFTSAQDDHVTITIYSVNGQLVTMLFNSDIKQSKHYKVPINENTLVQGSYYCIIRSNNKVYSRKLVFIK